MTEVTYVIDWDRLRDHKRSVRKTEYALVYGEVLKDGTTAIQFKAHGQKTPYWMPKDRILSIRTRNREHVVKIERWFVETCMLGVNP